MVSALNYRSSGPGSNRGLARANVRPWTNTNLTVSLSSGL